MAGPTDQPFTNIDTEFTIKAIENLTSNHELDGDNNPEQVPFSLSVKGVPFSLSIKGVPFLRDRDTAYKVEK